MLKHQLNDTSTNYDYVFSFYEVLFVNPKKLSINIVSFNIINFSHINFNTS